VTFDPAAATSCASGHCVTCADEGVAMTVVELDERSGLALCVDREGASRAVETALLGALSRGDRVLVHADVAIASLPPDGLVAT
jgi:hydrogenase maturation factor